MQPPNEPLLTTEQARLLLLLYASGSAPSDPLGIVRLQTLGLIRKPIGDAKWYVTEQGVRWLESHALRAR